MEYDGEEMARAVGEIISDVTQSGQNVEVGYTRGPNCSQFIQITSFQGKIVLYISNLIIQSYLQLTKYANYNVVILSFLNIGIRDGATDDKILLGAESCCHNNKTNACNAHDLFSQARSKGVPDAV